MLPVAFAVSTFAYSGVPSKPSDSRMVLSNRYFTFVSLLSLEFKQAYSHSLDQLFLQVSRTLYAMVAHLTAL